MFNYLKTLWFTLQCPSPTEMLEEGYALPHAEDTIKYFDHWIPYLCDYDKHELIIQIAFDLAYSFDNDTYANKLFHWLETNHPCD